jgi:hypothetical protein
MVCNMEQHSPIAQLEPPTNTTSEQSPPVHPADLMIGPDDTIMSLAASQVTDSMVSHATMRSQPLAVLMACGAMPTFKGQAQSVLQVRGNPSLAQNDDVIATLAFNEGHYSPLNSSSQSHNNNNSMYHQDEGQETIPVVQAVPWEASRSAQRHAESYDRGNGWNERHRSAIPMDYNDHVETKPPRPPLSSSSSSHRRRRPWTVWAARSTMVAGAILVVAASASGILCRTRQCPLLHRLRRNHEQQQDSNVDMDTATTPTAPSPPMCLRLPSMWLFPPRTSSTKPSMPIKRQRCNYCPVSRTQTSPDALAIQWVLGTLVG